jgi:hypothetical protein
VEGSASTARVSEMWTNGKVTGLDRVGQIQTLSSYIKRHGVTQPLARAIPSRSQPEKRE